MFDERMLDLLAKFHCSDLDNIKKYCKYGNRSISDKRINMFIEKEYIKKDKIKIKNKVIQIYYLGEKGKKYIKGIYRNTTCTAYRSNSKKHDFKHLESVMNEYDVEDIRKYYKSEFELEKAKICDKESRTDGALIYNDERQDIYIETITQHYTAETILAKQKYAANRNALYREIKVRV